MERSPAQYQLFLLLQFGNNPNKHLMLWCGGGVERGVEQLHASVLDRYSRPPAEVSHSRCPSRAALSHIVLHC